MPNGRDKTDVVKLPLTLLLALALFSFGCKRSDAPEAGEPSPKPELTFPSDEEICRELGAKNHLEKWVGLTGAVQCMFLTSVPMSIAKPERVSRMIEKLKLNRDRIASEFASSDLSNLEPGLPSRSEMTPRYRLLAESGCSYGLSFAIRLTLQRIKND
jgi:hypothetical protein